MQETWAIHGVYPTMAWTQDNKDIFFWAKGKINRLNVASKTLTDIPFSVKTELAVQPSVRFKQDIDKDVFDVKMLRMAQVSPDGSKVAFEALGKIWLKSLPDGKMSRLTELNNGVEELYPQWSRDGKNIVFTTWNDQEQGTVQVLVPKVANLSS